MLGKLNGEHWYLYMTERPEKKYEQAHIDSCTTFRSSHFDASLSLPREGLAPDATLEILMSDLDQTAMKPFYKQHCSDARAASTVCTPRFLESVRRWSRVM